MILVALVILFHSVFSQDKVTFQFATYTSSSTLIPVAESTAISHALSNLTAPIIQISPESSCTPGVLIGTFEFQGKFLMLIQVPNGTSIFTSGSQINITWGFSQYVTIVTLETS